MTKKEANIRQLQHQSETWKRDLGFISEENATLKYRVGEIVADGQITPDFLERIEAYQNDFIAKDEVVRLIVAEIKEWDKLLVQEQHLNGREIKGKLIATQRKLSHAVESFMREFSRLKFDFNNYMSETL